MIRIRSHELPFIRAEQIHSIRKNSLPLVAPAQRLDENAFADLLQVAPLPWSVRVVLKNYVFEAAASSSARAALLGIVDLFAIFVTSY